VEQFAHRSAGFGRADRAGAVDGAEAGALRGKLAKYLSECLRNYARSLLGKCSPGLRVEMRVMSILVSSV
jgi:hypothetical protein